MEHGFALLTVLTLFALSGKCTDAFSRYDFPDGFLFGAGSSAYQWEGAVAEDGKTPSVWDTYCHSHNKGNGDIACDGYHKYKGDVKLMAETGLDAFRFSISWSRLIPHRGGSVNRKGLQFYKNLIQELVSYGIEPHVTLYHYDHPQYLEDEYGGWLNRRMIKDFTTYADVCFKEFGNHVKFWTTINEANVFTTGGYNDGDTPPARCSKPGNICLAGNSSTEPYIVAHNLVLAHASASRLYRQKYKDMQGGSVGYSLYMIGFTPLTSSKDDLIATQRAKDFYTGWMLGPLIYGDYPDEMKRIVGSRLPVFSKKESELVKGSIDFVGVNHYLAASVGNIKSNISLSGDPDYYSDMGVSLNFLGNLRDMDYPVVPWALEGVLEFIKQSFGNPPVFILENGTPLTQQTEDTARIEYMNAYIGGVLKAVRNGSDTRGYIAWSFMDLYEIITGYDYSFGLYYVNFSDPHRKRSPKLSAHWYSGFLKGKNTIIESQDITHLQSNFSTRVS